jgi:hypothetical protein
MEIDGKLREMIHNRSDESEIRTYLLKKGQLSLREEGLLLVKKGMTTLEEIMRVTYGEEASIDDPVKATLPGSSPSPPAPAAGEQGEHLATAAGG